MRWDGIRTISLHCEIHILWEIPRGPSDLGVESEWGPPSPIHQPAMGASISAIYHPLADWNIEGQLPGLLHPQPSSTHRRRRCSSRQVGDVSGSTTRTPSQCSLPSTAKACYYRAPPYEATLAVVAHGLASPDFRQLFCTLYRHISLDRNPPHHRAYPHHLPNNEPLQNAQTTQKTHRTHYRRKGCHRQVCQRPSRRFKHRPWPKIRQQPEDRAENPQE